MRQKQQNSGFTLMEVLVVVAIISILSTIGLLNWRTYVDRSKRTATLDEIREYGLQEGIARGDTGLFWRLQDLQSNTMPRWDVYGRLVNDPNGNSIVVDTTMWKGPYLSLQKTVGPDSRSKFDDAGYPIDLYGNRYRVALLKVQDNTTTLMDNPSDSPAIKPDVAMVISWGKDQQPGNAASSVTYAQRSAYFWLYYNELGSDDVYYFF